MCVAAWKSRVVGPSAANAGGSTARRDDRLHRAACRAPCAAARTAMASCAGTNAPTAAASSPPIGATISAASATARVCTEPWLPPRPHLLGHERQERREQPQHRRRAPTQHGAVGGRRAPRAAVAVAARLHQLEVVVAEASRRTSRCARARARSRRPRAPSVASRPRRDSVASIAAIERLGDRAARAARRCSRARTATRSAASSPGGGRPSSGRRRTPCRCRAGRSPPSSARASEPCSSSRPIGVTTLPFDFDIFLRSGSSDPARDRGVASTAACRARAARAAPWRTARCG